MAGILFFSYTDAESIIIGDITPEKIPKEFCAHRAASKSMITGTFFSEILSDRAPIMDYEESAQYEPEKIGWVIVSFSDQLDEEKRS